MLAVEENCQKALFGQHMPANGWALFGFKNGIEPREYIIRSQAKERKYLFGSKPFKEKPDYQEMGFFHEQIPGVALMIIRNVLDRSTVAGSKKKEMADRLEKPLDRLNLLFEAGRIKPSYMLTSYQNWKKNPRVRNFPEYMKSSQEKFFETCQPFHLQILEIITNFDKKKTYYEKQLNLVFNQEAVDSIEQKYMKARTVMYSKIINLCFSTLDPYIPGHLKTQLKYDERLRLEITEKRKPSTLEIVKYISESVKGGENAKELDEIALKINRHYRSLTVRDILEESEAYGISSQEKTYLQQFGHLKLVDLHHRLQSKKQSKINENYLDKIAFKLFKNKDVLGPLIEGVSKLFQDVPVSKASSLIYLLYQIENPFIEPSEESFKATNRAYNLYKKQQGTRYRPISKEILQKVSGMIDNFDFIEKKWINAWMYFGPEEAGKVVRLLSDPKYGTLFFKDLVDFANNKKIISPAQILGITRQFNTEKSNLSHVEILKKLYDSGETLFTFTQKNEIVYQISGLNRGYEYSQKGRNRKETLIEELIPEKYRSGFMLSLGGGLGLVEAIRAKLLNWTGPIVSVDKLSYKELLKRALIFKNEFKYSPGDPCLTSSEIEKILKSSPRQINHVQGKLPLTKDDLIKIVNSYGLKPNEKITIFDQRATFPYLSGDDLLKSIGSSLELLAGNNGGIYFVTKGWVDKLFIDQGFEISINENGQAVINLNFLHHSNSFYSSEQVLIQGTHVPADSNLFAEGGSRFRIKQGNGLVPVNIQPGRRAKELDKQQKIQTAFLISEEFFHKFPFLLMEVEASASRQFAIAYAYQKGLPLYINPNFQKDEIPEYKNCIDILAQTINIYKNHPDMLPVYIEGSINKIRDMIKRSNQLTSFKYAIESFLGEIRNNHNILKEPIKWLDQTFSSVHQIAIFPSNPNCTPFLLKNNNINEVKGLYSRGVATIIKNKYEFEFSHDFLYIPEEHFPSQIILRAIFQLLNLPEVTDDNISTFSPKQTKVIKTDANLIIQEIIRKIIYLNRNEKYWMNFSKIKNRKLFFRHLEMLGKADKQEEVWKRLLSFIEQQEVRSMQRTM